MRYADLKRVRLSREGHKIAVQGYPVGGVFALRPSDQDGAWDPVSTDVPCSLDHLPTGYLVGRFKLSSVAFLFALTALEWVGADAIRSLDSEEVAAGFPPTLKRWLDYLQAHTGLGAVLSYSEWCGLRGEKPLL